MARVNVYLPDDLADDVKGAGINVSSITQQALRRELDARRTTGWLEAVRRLSRPGIGHDEVIGALNQVRAESGDTWPQAGDADPAA